MEGEGREACDCHSKSLSNILFTQNGRERSKTDWRWLMKINYHFCASPLLDSVRLKLDANKWV